MHPISIRGRSMSRDRQTLRAVFVIVGIVACSLSTGCLRSTMLRPADGPVAQPASMAPAAPLASVAPPGPIATPPTVLQAAPTPIQEQAALAPPTPQPRPASPPATAPAGEKPAANSTPLMDAAIERVAAVTRQQRESPDSAASPFESDDHAATPVAPGSPALVPTAPFHQGTPTPLLVADTTESSHEVAPTVDRPINSPNQPATPTVPKDEAQPIGLEAPTKVSISGAESAGPTHEAAGTLLDDAHPVAAAASAVAGDTDPLSIAKLCMCRRILGFGSVEPFKDSRIKAGQRILLYCEMTGMQYESKDASFVSRLSSKIEIGSVENGVFQWARRAGPRGRRVRQPPS